MASGYREKMYVIPPRNPTASPEMIDLTPYYTSSKRGYNSLAALPGGLRTIASTPFDIRGVIELSRMQDRGVEGAYPEKITGIKIGLKSRRLHFLHATNFETKDGTRVGDYVVHYANHETQVIPIVYGKDLRNWWTVPGEPFNTQNSTLVWIGSNPVVQSQSKSLRMFKSAWENPVPDEEIISLDFLSAMSDAAPFLMAITAD